jgi:hypothetical protein
MFFINPFFCQKAILYVVLYILRRRILCYYMLCFIFLFLLGFNMFVI